MSVLYCKGESLVKQQIKNVVLVHGAFADGGSGWEAKSLPS